jgi:hypothetical protein
MGEPNIAAGEWILVCDGKKAITWRRMPVTGNSKLQGKAVGGYAETARSLAPIEL